jgi:hypothetical protein
VRASTCNGAGLIQDVHTRDLETKGERIVLIIYGVMLKVELESSGGFHSADRGAMP